MSDATGAVDSSAIANVAREGLQMAQTLQQQGKTPIETPWWSNQNAMTMCSVLLIFGALMGCLTGYLLLKAVPTDALIKTMGMILIVIGALFLVVAGYNDQQIAPAFGLLGAVAGYLFGKSSSGPSG